MKIALKVLFLISFLYLPYNITAQVKLPENTGIYPEMTFSKSAFENILQSNKVSLSPDTLRFLKENYKSVKLMKYEEGQLSVTSIILIVASAVIVVILGLSLVLE